MPKPKFATFEQALATVIMGRAGVDIARADLARAWEVRERAQKALSLLNTLAAGSSENQYGICRAIPVVEEILIGEGTYRAEPFHLADELRKAGLGEEAS